MEREHVEKAKKRYKEITSLIKGDAMANSLLKALVHSVSEYVEIVTNRGAVKQVQRFRLEEGEYDSLVYNLDVRRTVSHDALISDLKILNRYLCENYENHIPAAGIYTLDPATISPNVNRTAVGDWAQYLSNGIREKNKEEK